jgi:hypothetical protein
MAAGQLERRPIVVRAGGRLLRGARLLVIAIESLLSGPMSSSAESGAEVSESDLNRATLSSVST